MPFDVALVVLASATMHATWNLLVKGAGDRLVALWVQLLAASIVGVPVLVAAGGIPAASLGWVGCSALVHGAYSLALIRAYDQAPLSLVYPVARGSAPVFALVGGVVFLGDDVAPGVIAGVIVVSLAVLSLAVGQADARGVSLALQTGACIATYSVLDAHIARRFDGGAVWAFAILMATTAVVGCAILLRATHRGEPKPLTGLVEAVRLNRSQVVGGVLGAVGYGLVLWAMQRAPVGTVSAVRETSVILGAVGGWLLLDEELKAQHLIGVVVVAGGVALIATA